MVSRVRGSSEIDHRNRKGDDHNGNRFLETHGNRSFPSKNSLYPLFCLTAFGHRNALPPHPAGGGVQSFEESQQNPGVMLPVGTAGQGRFIAGLLREVGEAPVEPPGEWAEPEDRAMQKGKTLSESVATRYVRHLVRDDRVEFGVVPFAPTGGQQNCGAQRTHGDRHGNEFGFERLGNEGKARGVGARGKPQGYARFVNPLRPLDQTAAECETHEEPC